MSSNKNVRKIKSNLKKRNYKAFFFFIGFTLLIWMFVQMSKTYEHDLDFGFKLKDIPQHIVVENTKKKVTARVEQTGFKLLSLHMFNSNLELNFDQLDSIGDSLVYNLESNKSELLKSLKLSTSEIEFAKPSIGFAHYQLTTKKLKIQPNFRISFSRGYDSIETFSFDPEYIEVSGNDSILKTLDYISTERKLVKDVSDTLQGQIKIQKKDSVEINYTTETINYTLPVSKFTEGSFEIPIRFENASLEKELIIFPKTVVVNFKTSLVNYERIDESGFEVIAKYKEDESFMKLELTKQPKHVKNVSLDNNKVDFLIKR